MRHARRTAIRRLAVPALALVLAAGCDTGESRAGDAERSGGAGAWQRPDGFWDRWGDGNAELAGYDLTYPRYGEPRAGSAVAIFVTETLRADTRVKAESEADGAPRYPVMKLNLIQDFPTGLYDYNLMTSVFVALEPAHDRPAGSAVKLTFSAQEWCGQAWTQVLFDGAAARYVTHSYFDGEADRAGEIAAGRDALPEDALPLWARGLAGPTLAPGESVDVPLLRAVESARVGHRALDVRRARLARSASTERVEVPAGTFDAWTYTARVEGGTAESLYPPGRGAVREEPRVWTLQVERDAPHRLLRWARDDGFEARLLGAERMPYWRMNGPGGEEALERLGLRPRAPRTP